MEGLCCPQAMEAVAQEGLCCTQAMEAVAQVDSSDDDDDDDGDASSTSRDFKYIEINHVP